MFHNCCFGFSVLNSQEELKEDNLVVTSEEKSGDLGYSGTAEETDNWILDSRHTFVGKRKATRFMGSLTKTQVCDSKMCQCTETG